MEANVQKTAMPMVAGILSIIQGAFNLLGFLGLIFVGLFAIVTPDRFRILNPVAAFAFIGVILIILGVLAIVGGVYALQRKNFGLSLTGAIAALLPFNLLGLAAVILMALSRREFEP